MMCYFEFLHWKQSFSPLGPAEHKIWVLIIKQQHSGWLFKTNKVISEQDVKFSIVL